MCPADWGNISRKRRLPKSAPATQRIECLASTHRLLPRDTLRPFLPRRRQLSLGSDNEAVRVCRLEPTRSEWPPLSDSTTSSNGRHLQSRAQYGAPSASRDSPNGLVRAAYAQTTGHHQQREFKIHADRMRTERHSRESPMVRSDLRLLAPSADCCGVATRDRRGTARGTQLSLAGRLRWRGHDRMLCARSRRSQSPSQSRPLLRAAASVRSMACGQASAGHGERQ